MSKDIEVGIVMNLVDRFSRKTKRINNSMNNVSRNGTRAMRAINKSAQLTGRALDKIGNRYAGLLTGVGAISTVRSVANLDKRLVFLGIQAGKTEEQIAKLRNRIFDISEMPDIRLDPVQILDAIDKIVEKTGDLDLAFNNMRNIGLAIRASNSQGGDIGAMIADLAEKFDVKTESGLAQALGLLINQGKAGAFTLQNLATQGERVTAAYAATGRVGIPALREMGAMLQIIKKGTGSPEQAATAFEALLRTLQDGKKQKLLRKGGISIVDPNDPKRMRAVTDIVKDLIKKTGGDITKLSTIFDGEAIRALNAVASEFKQTGKFSSLDNFLNQSSDGTQLLSDAAAGVNQLEASLTGLNTAWKRYSFEKLQKPMKGLIDSINSVDPNKLGNIINGIVIGGGLLGGAVFARKIGKGLKGKSSISGSGSALASLASKTRPIPVWVVNNMPGKVPANIASKFGRASGVAVAGAGRFSKLSKLAKFGKFALPATIAFDAYQLADGVVNDDFVKQGSASGGLSGGALGAATGAAIGSVVPIIGTAIGAIVGSIAGSFGGSYLGEKLGQSIEDKRKIEVSIKVDQDGRIQNVDALSSDSNLDYSVDTGLIMGGGGF